MGILSGSSKDKKDPNWNLRRDYEPENISYIPNEKFGLNFVYGSTDVADRVKVGMEPDEYRKQVQAEQYNYPTEPWWVELTRHDEKAEVMVPINNHKHRPAWHDPEFETERPWHAEGEEITRHYDRDQNLLAKNMSYRTVEDVLDAIRNDEYVPRPPSKTVDGWTRFEARFVQPLLGREVRFNEDDRRCTHSIYTGRHWGSVFPHGEWTEIQDEMAERFTREIAGIPEPVMEKRKRNFFVKNMKNIYAGWTGFGKGFYANVLYVPRFQEEDYFIDGAQNRLYSAMERQKSFDERYKYYEHELMRLGMIHQKRDRQRQGFVTRKLEFMGQPVTRWKHVEEDHHAIARHRGIICL